MLSAGLRTNCRETRMKAGTPDGRAVILIQSEVMLTWITTEVDKVIIFWMYF